MKGPAHVPFCGFCRGTASLLAHWCLSNGVVKLLLPHYFALLHFSEATNEITPPASVNWRSENLGCQNTADKKSAPRESGKTHTAAGGIFQCLRLPSACDRGSSGVGWSAIIFIASDNHISYNIYIYARPYLYLILSLHRHLASGHNFVPDDALARKQCRARVLAALGRALGVGPTGPFHHTPATTPKVRANQVRPSLHWRPYGHGALQLRRSKHDGGTSKCAGAACKRTYRYHLWLLSALAQRPPVLCPKPKGVPSVVTQAQAACHLADALEML
jgi:hypothetical protein